MSKAHTVRVNYIIICRTMRCEYRESWTHTMLSYTVSYGYALTLVTVIHGEFMLYVRGMLAEFYPIVQAPAYQTLSDVIKVGCKAAVWLSERI